MAKIRETDSRTAAGTSSGPVLQPLKHPLRRFADQNRAALGTLAVFIVMMAVFIVANPRVFSEWSIYRSVLTTLPVAIFVVVPLVFVVTAGEIDLSFPATMGFSSWIFALVVQAGHSPYLAILSAIATGMLLGFVVGSTVVYLNLSSLIATLGMNFMLRGVIEIFTEGKSIALTSLTESSARTLFSDLIFDIPTQVFWALPSSSSRPWSTTGIASAPMSRSWVTTPRAQNKWAST